MFVVERVRNKSVAALELSRFAVEPELNSSVVAENMFVVAENMFVVVENRSVVVENRSVVAENRSVVVASNFAESMTVAEVESMNMIAEAVHMIVSRIVVVGNMIESMIVGCRMAENTTARMTAGHNRCYHILSCHNPIHMIVGRTRCHNRFHTTVVRIRLTHIRSIQSRMIADLHNFHSCHSCCFHIRYRNHCYHMTVDHIRYQIHIHSRIH